MLGNSSDLKERVASLSSDIHNAIQKQLKENVEKILNCAEESCPLVTKQTVRISCRLPFVHCKLVNNVFSVMWTLLIYMHAIYASGKHYRHVDIFHLEFCYLPGLFYIFYTKIYATLATI